jgi:hypothetical protein
MQILSYGEAAARAGVVRRTLERLISVGEGPAIVEVSTRRRGILDCDLDVAPETSSTGAWSDRRSRRSLRDGRPNCGEIRRPARCGRRLPDIFDAWRHEVSGYRTFSRGARLNRG